MSATLNDLAAAAPIARRRRLSVNWLVIGARVASAAVVIAAWQIFAGGPKSLLPTDAISRPSTIVAAVGDLIHTGDLFTAIGGTASSVAIGMAIAAPAGVIVALLTAAPVGRWLLQPFVTITYAIPKVALISLFVLIMGPNAKSHIGVVITAIVFVYYYAVSQGLADLDRDQIQALRLMGAGLLRTGWTLVLPSIRAQLFAATRIAIPLGFALEIFSELSVPTTSGLGAELAKYSQSLDAGHSMAVLIVVVIVAYLLDVVVGTALIRYTKSIGQGIER